MMESSEIQERTSQRYLDNLGLTWGYLRGKKILDIGSGSSMFAKEAKKYGIEVISSDERRELDRPRETSNVISVAEHLPFKDESFDLVVSNNCVDWINLFGDASAVIKEAKRVLKPGGEFRFDSDRRLYRLTYRSLDPAIEFRQNRFTSHSPGFGYLVLKKD